MLGQQCVRSGEIERGCWWCVDGGGVRWQWAYVVVYWESGWGRKCAVGGMRRWVVWMVYVVVGMLWLYDRGLTGLLCGVVVGVRGCGGSGACGQEC